MEVITSHFEYFCITFESKFYKAMALYSNESFCQKKIKNRKYLDIRPWTFKRGNRVWVFFAMNVL